MHRMDLRSDKLNELFSGINDEFSISFHFTPLEVISVILNLRNTDSLETYFTVGKLNVEVIHLFR